MIHWQTIKEFFGFGGTVVEETAGHDHSPPPPPPKPALRVIEPVTRQPQISLKKAQARKVKTNPKHYYRRGGNYYSTEDDSLIEDLMLLYVLSELFTDNDVPQYNDGNFAANENTFDVNQVNEVPEDLLDIDVSSTPVVEPATSYTPPEPTYTPPEPEPVRESYSSYSDSDSSSSYDSGSSDSGGGYD